MMRVNQQAAGSGQRAVKRSRRAARPGFTLTEILVVIVIIVLVLGMAVPVFKFITGSRSEEGAINQITAMLGRVRADAIGVQKPIGLAFISDGSTNRGAMAEVEFANCPEWNNQSDYAVGDYVKRTDTSASPSVVYYFICGLANGKSAPQPPPFQQIDGTYWLWVGGPPIDLRAGTDLENLPTGVAVQTMCDYITNNTTPPPRLSDSYLGTGVILFGADGSLTLRTYGIAQTGRLGNAATFRQRYPNVQAVTATGTTTFGVMSQIGMVVFDRDAFVGQGFTSDDTTYTVATASVQASYKATPPGQLQSEEVEEQWLDNNAQALLINRFNGTLVRPD
jgi:prepilin-type N-terminal cleavage/methylation domain-containing protein